MTREQAIKALNIVEVHGLADECHSRIAELPSVTPQHFKGNNK